LPSLKGDKMKANTVILLTSSVLAAIPVTVFVEQIADKLTEESPKTEFQQECAKIAPPVIGWVVGTMFAHMVFDLTMAIKH
jgi:hypothetical protein